MGSFEQAPYIRCQVHLNKYHTIHVKINSLEEATHMNRANCDNSKKILAANDEIDI
jgi:hypothetical protein